MIELEQVMQGDVHGTHPVVGSPYPSMHSTQIKAFALQSLHLLSAQGIQVPFDKPYEIIHWLHTVLSSGHLRQFKSVQVKHVPSAITTP